MICVLLTHSTYRFVIAESMTLTSALSAIADMTFVTLSFANESTPDLLFDALRSHCSIDRKIDKMGCVQMTMRPNGSLNRRLVIFCDEINLPKPDTYGSQPILALIRQISERSGFWDVSSCTWYVV